MLFFRNRSKSITLVFPPAFTIRLFFVHVDNTRDVSNKTTYVTFFAGASAEEVAKVHSTEVDARHVGWVKFQVKKPEGITVIKVEFKGPDNRLDFPLSESFRVPESECLCVCTIAMHTRALFTGAFFSF